MLNKLQDLKQRMSKVLSTDPRAYLYSEEKQIIGEALNFLRDLEDSGCLVQPILPKGHPLQELGVWLTAQLDDLQWPVAEAKLLAVWDHIK